MNKRSWLRQYFEVWRTQYHLILEAQISLQAKWCQKLVRKGCIYKLENAALNLHPHSCCNAWHLCSVRIVFEGFYFSIRWCKVLHWTIGLMSLISYALSLHHRCCCYHVLRMRWVVYKSPACSQMWLSWLRSNSCLRAGNVPPWPGPLPTLSCKINHLWNSYAIHKSNCRAAKWLKV